MTDLHNALNDLLEVIEPGNDLTIIFHKGTQLESLEGDTYDDNSWEIYIRDDVNSTNRFLAVSNVLVDALRYSLLKLEGE